MEQNSFFWLVPQSGKPVLTLKKGESAAFDFVQCFDGRFSYEVWVYGLMEEDTHLGLTLDGQTLYSSMRLLASSEKRWRQFGNLQAAKGEHRAVVSAVNRDCTLEGFLITRDGVFRAKQLYRAVEDGYIGTPLGAAGFMICHGHESWHPDPEFYYKSGGGPMFDMGPYYLTAMVNLLGNVSEVFAMTKSTFSQRLITSREHFGEIIDVDVPTHYAGTMSFESGAIGTLFTTFDVFYDGQARLEIYGSEGTLYVPDPNGFGGPVKLLRPEHGVPQEIPLTFPYKDNSRALGLADAAKAISSGRRPRANADMTYHVLEIMEGFAASGKEKRIVPIESRFEKTPIMRRGGMPGMLDA